MHAGGPRGPQALLHLRRSQQQSAARAGVGRGSGETDRQSSDGVYTQLEAASYIHIYIDIYIYVYIERYM